MSRGFEAEGVDDGVEVIDNTLVEAIELRSLLLADLSIRADGAEKASGERRIDAFEEFQEDETGNFAHPETIRYRVGRSVEACSCSIPS